MNNGSGNAAEYTVARKPVGKNMGYKIGCLTLYVALVVGYLCLAVAMGTSSIVVVVATLPFVPLFFLLLRHFVWNRYVNVEYKYEIVSAEVIFYEVYGKQRQAEIYRHRISEFSLIAPVEAAYESKYTGADEVRDYRGDSRSSDAYFMLLENEGKRTVIFFEAAEKTLKALKYYNSKNLVATRQTSR